MTTPALIAETLETIKSAARALEKNPLRRGSCIFLPDNGEVMIAGDLHGDVANFHRLVSLAALDENPSRHLILQELVHGNDAPSSPGGSAELVELACRLISRHPGRVHLLMGNHEMAEFTLRPVMKNGTVLNEVFRKSLDERYGESSEEVLAYMCALWRSMPLAARTADGVFISHSTPRASWLDDFDPQVLLRPLSDEDCLPGGSAYALCWGRDFKPETAERLSDLLEADVFVVGHTPCENGYTVPNSTHVIIDSRGESGAYLLLPLGVPLTLPEIVGRIRPLWS